MQAQLWGPVNFLLQGEDFFQFVNQFRLVSGQKSRLMLWNFQTRLIRESKYPNAYPSRSRYSYVGLVIKTLNHSLDSQIVLPNLQEGAADSGADHAAHRPTQGVSCVWG